MIEIAAPQASNAGVLTSIASIITALTVLIGAIVGGAKVLVPMLRETRENTEHLARQDEHLVKQDAKLSVIHTLVNSTLTAALQSELDATRREELLLREVMRMRTESGHEATDDQMAALGATQRKIRELTAAMRDRELQTRSADIQMETERTRVSGI